MGNDYYNDQMLSKWEDEYLEEHEDKEYDNNYYLEKQDLIYQDILAKIDEDITLDEVNNIIHYLFKRELIQKREAALLLQTLSTVFDKLDAKERVSFIKSLIMTLANFS